MAAERFTSGEWRTHAPSTTQPPIAAEPAPPPPTALTPGQNLTLPEEAWDGLTIAFKFGGAEADLTLFLTDAQSRVASDEDFVFCNSPLAPKEPCTSWASRTTARTSSSAQPSTSQPSPKTSSA
ncbi:hypothetical protein ABCR94_33035 [Streptomyces sp. 21So2-11]|uniref:hypothetical protein n=1 Tax=Streptomyces sp. 21So2-11 TaxID=3144408 RepID=UPI00321BC0B9